jgi:oxygen-dependent protoporphyrinogen oxidase
MQGTFAQTLSANKLSSTPSCRCTRYLQRSVTSRGGLPLASRHQSHATSKRVAHVTRATAAPITAGPSSTASGSDPEVYDAVIVGGGISGLSTAQALLAEHSSSVHSFLVTEGRDRVGGNITSVSNAEGYQWEEGPNSFQPNDAMLKAAVDAGVEKELVFGDPKAPRFVWWEGKLRPTPSGLDVLTFDLVSIIGKIRAGLGAIGIKAPLPGKGPV